VWLDLFRGVAVLVMIEAHVVNAFLATSLREHSWFPLLDYANGLVAPSFLFIAGFVQGMERRNNPGRPIPYARRAVRLLGIAILGYALHFPFAELAGRRWPEALRVGTQVDVLPCLALGLGLLLALSWLTEGWPRSRAGAVWWGGVTTLAILAVLGAPQIQSWLGGPVPLRAWVNGTTGSLFPLFPWIGFVLLGALLGAWRERPLSERAAGLIGLAILAWACRGAIFSAASPAFFLERAVWVLALAGLCEWGARGREATVVLYAGKHSLKLYVVHLLLVTSLAGLGVPVAVLGLPSTLAVLVSVVAVSLGAAHLLDRLLDRRSSIRPAVASAVIPGPAAVAQLPR
jgi:uncharacterized membrane protein